MTQLYQARKKKEEKLTNAGFFEDAFNCVNGNAQEPVGNCTLAFTPSLLSTVMTPTVPFGTSLSLFVHVTDCPTLNGDAFVFEAPVDLPT